MDAKQRPRSTTAWRSVAGLLAGALALPSGAGCHDSRADGGGGDVSDATPVVDLVVDANRDGRLDTTGSTDEAGKNDFTASAGAVILANLDDDDGDGKADVTSGVVDGDADVKDLTPFALRAWPKAPDGASGDLTVDEAAASHLKIWLVQGSPERASSYVDIGELPIHVAPGDVRAGLLFALEARSFAGVDGWDGKVHLTWQVKDGAGKVLGKDDAQLRVAPLLFQWNTAKTEEVFFTDAADYNQALSDGLDTVCTGGVKKTALEFSDRAFDQWTQDFFDVGWTSHPGPDGKPVGMKVFVRSAQPDREAGSVILRQRLGPDRATVFVHGPPMDDSAGHGYSMNSFGNWDVVPPYEIGGTKYPLGRNIWGEGRAAVEQPDPAFAAFVAAQSVQPPINVDTSWLVVGHVDEFSSFVKTNTPRGWGLLAGSPRVARQLLLDLQAAGNGRAVLFTGKEDYDFTDPNESLKDASATIDEVLADADLLAESQKAQVEIDEQVAKLKTEIGLADAEVTEIPFLFMRVYGDALAYQPGTVNLLFVDGKVAVPKPFGPVIGGKDPFEEDLKTRLGGLGLDVHFADDWDLYHIEMGEVHCGTNVSRDVNLAWWETGR